MLIGAEEAAVYGGGIFRRAQHPVNYGERGSFAFRR
jgi:hypothetical protein